MPKDWLIGSKSLLNDGGSRALKQPLVTGGRLLDHGSAALRMTYQHAQARRRGITQPYMVRSSSYSTKPTSICSILESLLEHAYFSLCRVSDMVIAQHRNPDHRSLNGEFPPLCVPAGDVVHQEFPRAYHAGHENNHTKHPELAN